MNRFSSLTKSLTGLTLALSLALSYATPARADSLVDSIMQTYGMQAFKRAREIRFTFHVKVLGFEKERQWLWKPQSDSVTRVDKAVAYGRKNMTEAQKALDAEFINDQYWLAFPLLCVMDTGVEITVADGLVPSPVKQESLRKVTVTYNQSVGYTPGDVYELFVTPQGLIKEWSYHKGGQKDGRNWTWEKQESFGGILISQDHQGPVHVFFSDIQVITADKP